MAQGNGDIPCAGMEQGQREVFPVLCASSATPSPDPREQNKAEQEGGREKSPPAPPGPTGSRREGLDRQKGLELPQTSPRIFRGHGIEFPRSCFPSLPTPTPVPGEFHCRNSSGERVLGGFKEGIQDHTDATKPQSQTSASPPLL